MAIYYRVEGIVQGVAFRYLTRQEAIRLGIRGTVKNLPDGCVEIYASSDEDSMGRFETFLRGSPGRSEVKKIVRKEVDKVLEENSFSILY